MEVKDWSRYSKSEANKLCSEQNFQSLTGVDINSKTEMFTEKLNNVLDQLVSTKKVNTQFSNKWFTLDLKNLQLERDAYYKIARSTNADIAWQDYGKSRNQYTNALKKSKSEYIQQEIENTKHDNKKMWKVLKGLLKEKHKDKSSLSFDNIIVDEAQEIAEKFNKYFIDSIVEINKSIPDTNPVIEKSAMKDVSFNSFRSISKEELLVKMKKIPNKSSSDNITIQILMDTFSTIGEFLVEIINESLRTGIVPDMYKRSMVVPIPKIAGTNKCQEFRPINMLLQCEKLLEMEVKDQLLSFINNNNIWIDEQSGFRATHSSNFLK